MEHGSNNFLPKKNHEKFHYCLSCIKSLALFSQSQIIINITFLINSFSSQKYILDKERHASSTSFTLTSNEDLEFYLFILLYF